MSEKLRASVIIPTYNGARKISGVLNSLLKQTVQPAEVIVAIDGSTDSTEEVLASYAEKFNNFEVVRQKNLGRSIVRNSGAAKASAEILIFYDDDMTPCPDSVEKHIRWQSLHRGLLCGDQIESPDPPKTDIQLYKGWIEKRWTKKFTDKITRMHAGNLFFTAANCSIPNELFRQLKGFDIRLKDAEDYDIAFRALQQQLAVYFDKTNKAFHHDPITCVSYIQRLRDYSNAHKQLKQLYDQKEANKKINRRLTKSLVYRCFALPLWPYLIDKGFFRIIIPKSLRYKLYSVVIQALAIEYNVVSLK
jgi:glycosyltransferase involved in cell wall biosynthesis